MKKYYFILGLFFMLPNLAMANVVVNGTFDNNTTGWTGVYNSQPGGSGGYPTIDTGPYYHGGWNGTHLITQVYDLTPDNLFDLASLGLNFDMSADLFGYSSQGDHSIFTASFYSDTGGVGSLLGSVSLDSATNDPGIWPSSFVAGSLPNFQSVSGWLPSTTSSVLLSLESIRLAGAANDGYADNLTFAISPVPAPASVWLFSLGLLTLLVSKRVRKQA